ncbi:hypothetical protein EJB05_47512, partial [Eragrostis curvula]
MRPPSLMNELVEEVLLRLPPDNPASLVRAALVCKRWCCLVSDPAFRCRIREFHRSPPMLGFLCNLLEDDGLTTRFVPVSSSSCLSNAGHRYLQVWNSRHGRVLLYYLRYPCFHLVVWDPIMDTRQELPRPPLPQYTLYPYGWAAAVLCAAYNGDCDHLNCHRGSFVIVLVGNTSKGMLSSVYFSKTGKWSTPSYTEQPGGRVSDKRSSVLVGKALYFLFEHNKEILEYDLPTGEMSILELPCDRCSQLVTLTTMDDGRLAFATMDEQYRLCLWSKDHQGLGWSLTIVIELEKKIPVDASLLLAITPYLVGSTESFGLIFLKVKRDLFTIDLRTGRVTKVYHGSRISVVVPYMSFYTPVLRAPSPEDDQE